MRLLRMKEVAEKLGVTRFTVYRWIKDNKFPRQARLAAKVCVWSEDEIDDWLQKHFDARKAA